MPPVAPAASAGPQHVTAPPAEQDEETTMLPPCRERSGILILLSR